MTRDDLRPISVVVVTGGLSQPSSTRLLADRLAAATAAAVEQRGGQVDLRVVELREWAHDLTNQLLTGFPSAGLREVQAAVADADAVIAVTPIFSASYSGLFKTFFDVLDVDALRGTPVLIAATAGSARHSLALEHALRPLFSYLRATVVPTSVFAASEDWSSAAGAPDGELTSRIERAATELATLVRPQAAPARPTARSDAAEVDASEGEVIPFARLLAAQRSATVQQLR